MGWKDDAKRLKDAASAKVNDPDFRRRAAQASADAVTAAATAASGLEAVVQRGGLTNRKGEISKFKVAKALLTPMSSSQRLLGAASDEWQERRAAAEAGRRAEATALPRDIPPLYPSFFENGLRAAGKPLTAHNIAAVAGLTSANLALNAERWLTLVGTPEVRQQWSDEFSDEDQDLVATGKRPDRMIDFLWHASPRLHAGLLDLVEQMRGTIVAAAGDFGPELPLDMWSAEGS